MKKTILIAALSVASAWAYNTPEVPDTIIDNIVWYDGNGGNQPFVSGSLGPGGTDYLDGDAVCNVNYPFPPPLYFTLIGGGIGVHNDVPACGTAYYYILGNPYSDRADGNYDHLSFYGFSNYPNQPGRPPNTPNIQSWGAACHEEGTDVYGNPNGLWGETYIKQYTPGTCWAP